MSVSPMILYKAALDMWGLNSQIDIALEEMAELSKALLKCRREYPAVDPNDVVQELVDVDIMVAQLRLAFNDEGKDPTMWHRHRLTKLDRLEKRLREQGWRPKGDT